MPTVGGKVALHLPVEPYSIYWFQDKWET